MLLLEEYSSAAEAGVSKFKKPKFAYKGFDKDLKCRGEQFAIGGVYTKPEKEKPKLCTTDGFNYFNELKDVYQFYGRDKASGNRFCKIEILGDFTESEPNPWNDAKCITTAFKIIEEIDYTIWSEENLRLDTVKRLQEKYPALIVGGSVALFLHGCTLDRWKYKKASDIDCIVPYYIHLESDEKKKVDDEEYWDEETSGDGKTKDFQGKVIFNDVSVDVCIDPYSRYETIEYKGFKYKVAKAEVILEAKIRYLLNGQKKHKDDIYELIGKVKP